MTQDSSIIHHAHGGMTLQGPDATELFRVITLKSSIGLHQNTGIIPTRGVTITKMFAMAERYTGKKYKRGQHDQVIADLTVWIETMKSALPVVDERKSA